MGAAAGSMGGALYHKNLGLSDADKQQLDKHLQNGGAALVVMADEDERGGGVVVDEAGNPINFIPVFYTGNLKEV